MSKCTNVRVTLTIVNRLSTTLAVGRPQTVLWGARRGDVQAGSERDAFVQFMARCERAAAATNRFAAQMKAVGDCCAMTSKAFRRLRDQVVASERVSGKDSA